MSQNQSFKFPTETVELPSKGYLYKDHPILSSGQVELKYPTAFHEDILTNTNYIEQGIVLDKFLSELLVEKFDVSDLLLGDKNALLIAARVMAYGSEYKFTYLNQEVVVDLSMLNNKTVDENLFTSGKNLFTFKTPKTSTTLEFSLLTGHDEKKIAEDLKGYKKMNKNLSPELSLRYKKMIKSVNGDNSPATISSFVDNGFIMQDTKAFKEYLKSINPDVDMSTTIDINGSEERVNIPIGLAFFWPELGV